MTESASLTSTLMIGQYGVIRTALAMYAADLATSLGRIQKIKEGVGTALANPESVERLTKIMEDQVAQAQVALSLLAQLDRALEVEGVYHAPAPDDGSGSGAPVEVSH